MNMRLAGFPLRISLNLVLLLGAATQVLGQDPSAQELATPPERTAPSAKELTEALAHLTRPIGVEGAGLAVGLKDRLLHLGTVGDFSADQTLPIASASKWLATAVILSLHDDGLLDIELPVSRYLKEFDRPDKKYLTLSQCLSCTAGFAAQSRTALDRDLDMDGVARELAEEPLQYEPGIDFVYSGVGFQVAACVAVRATKTNWHTLFRDRVADRLGMMNTAFGRLSPVGSDAGAATVPWIAGGAVSSLRDYERVCAMLGNGGELRGVRVLKPESLDRMFRSQTARTLVRFPGFEGDLAYGLATWLQEPQAGVVRGSDPGAFGFLPWVDRDQGLWGVLAIQDRVARVLPRIGAVQAAARAFVKSPAISGTDELVRLECGGRTRSYRLHVPPGGSSAAKLPVVMVFHGGGGNSAQVEESTGFSKLADRRGFVAVYPDGTGLLRNKLLTWNSGGIPVYAGDKNVDDTEFVRAVLADLKQRIAVDPDRVFATGMSNGGMMCHRLAREAADLFAGIAPVSGAMNFTDTDATSPVAVMIVHGTADLHVRYDGGKPERSMGRAGRRVDAAVADAAKYYRTRNGLTGEPETTVDGGVRIETWQADERTLPVCVVTIGGGGHAWPGGTRGNYLGADEPVAWDATVAIWGFFAPLQTPRDAGAVPTPR